MTTSDSAQQIAPDQLPEAISTYLAAHQARDIDVHHFTQDAIVVDEGHSYHGHEQIRDWLQRSASEYSYTIELIGAQKTDNNHYVATHHLEGNFPGSVVDLRFQFTLRNGRIARLIIEP
ncbi:MAG: hypothetical protein QOE40_520 [Actinomycetota bacterium]|jgi:ketosteroid isomerase-like protein|nr:hypothetical protein [Actinomycetota bacterium]